MTTEARPGDHPDPALAGSLLRRVRLDGFSHERRRALVERSAIVSDELRAQARAILFEVRAAGDGALRAAIARFGGGLTRGPGGEPERLRVPTETLAPVADALPADLRRALEQMSANIQRFHAAQMPPPEQWVDVSPGIRVGRVWRPLDHVAPYVPGGSAAYPSSLLMAAIRARGGSPGGFS